MSAAPCRDTGQVERDAVEAAAIFLYLAWWEHRTVVEQKILPDWEHLSEEKRARYRAQARAVRKWMRVQLGS